MIWVESLADMVYLVAILSISVVTYFYYCFLYWKHKEIPYISPTFPYGSVKSLILSQESFGEALCNIHKQFKDCKYGGFYIFSMPALILTDPDLIKSVLIKDFAHFHDRGLFTDNNREPLSGNLFVTTGPKWRKLRKKITPVFSSGNMKIMFCNFLQTAEELISVLDRKTESESIDIKQLLSNFNIDMIASCVFGLEIHALQGNHTEFLYFSQLFLKSTLANNFLISFGIAYNKLLTVLLALLYFRPVKYEVSKFYTNLLKNIIENREKNNIHRKDFIEMYIKMKNINRYQGSKRIEDDDINEEITFNEFAAQAFLFFIAGYETSAQTLTFCLYELSIHKDIQDKLRNEIISSINNSKRKIDYDKIIQMQYLDRVIKETLRKYPSAGVIQRKCTKIYKVYNSNLVIEKDTPVWISVQGLHKDPKYFPNPEKFDPDRFTEEENVKRHPFTYLPFGEGPRNCIGSRFALLQIKTGLTLLLKKFKFSLDSQTKTPLEFCNKGVLLSTKNIIYLRAHKL